MGNKISRNFLMLIISMAMVIVVLTFIGFNASADYIYENSQGSVAGTSLIYLDSIEKIKYSYSYDDGYRIVSVISTLYISIVVIITLLALYALLTASFLWKFKNKQVYSILKLLNIFIGLIIVTFIIVLFGSYITKLNDSARIIENSINNNSSTEVKIRFMPTIKTWFSFIFIIVAGALTIGTTYSNNLTIINIYANRKLENVS